jgi:hypothetical protein
MFNRFSNRMRNRSAALLLTLDRRLDRILICWLLAAGFAAALRIASAPHAVPAARLSTFLSYLLVVVAPFASTLLALHWFPRNHQLTQPSTRLAIVGCWRSLSRAEAERHPLYGCSGIMVSLMLGMMINVPVRAAEYLTAMPPLPLASPPWLSALHYAMTVDVVLFSSLYMIAFVAALRRVPLFPRLLVAIWFGDLLMQLASAEILSTIHLPIGVAVALKAMLVGNVKKVLISMALWLPYLLLSKRVNVTYRHRLPD